MLTPTKKTKLLSSLRAYNKKYLKRGPTELDESDTRLMINDLLTNILGYTTISEVKTEYMTKGTYIDYVIQVNRARVFLIEVKKLSSFDLSKKHLRQAINYAVHEGIEWALITNGRCFDLYRILFKKPVDARMVFSVDLSDKSKLKQAAEALQFLHKSSVLKKGLHFLWNQSSALDPSNIAGLLYSPVVTNFLKRALRTKFKVRFSEKEIHSSIDKIITDSISLDEIKQSRGTKSKAISKKNPGALTVDRKEGGKLLQI
jgi:hypothetical protein